MGDFQIHAEGTIVLENFFHLVLLVLQAREKKGLFKDFPYLLETMVLVEAIMMVVL